MSHPSQPTLAASRAIGPFRVSEVLYPADFRQARHAHEEAGVSMLLAGSLRETSGRAAASAATLSLVVKPAHVEHADEVGPQGSRTLQIVVDYAYARTLERIGDGLGPWRWLHAPPAVRDMLALLRLLRAGGAVADADVEDGVLAVLAGVARGPVPGGGMPGWVRRVREELDDRPTEGVRVHELAAAAGVHPVSLARAFRRHYGVSITGYRKRQRLQHAAHAAAGCAAPLGRIAHASGYADQAHFCREFRAATGATPSSFRRLVGRR